MYNQLVSIAWGRGFVPKQLNTKTGGAVLDLTDKTLVCRDCGQEFPFTAGEQEFFLSHELSEPKRCPACRSARRNEQRGSSDNSRQSYPAICAMCGKETMLPFEPVEGREVYCRECFKNKSA